MRPGTGSVKGLCAAIRVAYVGVGPPRSTQCVLAELVHGQPHPPLQTGRCPRGRQGHTQCGRDLLLTTMMWSPMSTYFKRNNMFDMWKDSAANPADAINHRVSLSHGGSSWGHPLIADN